MDDNNSLVHSWILNKPKKMNHLTLEMLYLMLDKLRRWKQNPEEAPVAIIFEGAGD
jgi:enoyl-CoA hydratase/carnithine racemase